MSNRAQWMVWSVTALVAGVCLTLGGAWAQQAMQAEPTAVAVVDVETAFDALDEKAAVEAQMRSHAEQVHQQQRQRQQRLAQLQEELQALNPGSQAFRQKQEEFQEAMLEAQFQAQYQDQRLNRERGLQMERIYRKMVDEVGRVAEEAGYDLVLYAESDPIFQYEGPQDLSAQIQMRKALYASESVDLTEQVVQRMNNAFEAGQ